MAAPPRPHPASDPVSLASLDDAIAVLKGDAPPPPSNFLALRGSINKAGLAALIDALRHSKFSGGLRLAGV